MRAGPGLRLGVVARLAWRDLRHGWPVTLCLVVAVIAALLPLLLLYGLRNGIVTNLIDDLRSDPRITEIQLVRDEQLSQEWFDDLAQDPRVGFLLPRARYLAASVRLRSDDGRAIMEPRMIPSAAGDPLLSGLTVPEGLEQIVITERVAIEAVLAPGDVAELIVLRQVGDERQSLRHAVQVMAVLPRDMLQTDDILVDSALESAIERWREGFAVPELGWEGVRKDGVTDASARSYASFRLYAADLRAVPSLRDSLLAQGLDVETRAEDIEATLAIEAGLGWVFAAVSVLTAVGFVLTLGLHLAAGVIEKVSEITLLRLLGMGSAELALFPSFQGTMIAGAGGVGAVLLAMAVQPPVNRWLDGLGGLQGQVSRLPLPDLALAALLVALAGGLSGIVAGARVAGIEPVRGLRNE
jgi:putative ABC transport system permease protein